MEFKSSQGYKREQASLRTVSHIFSLLLEHFILYSGKHSFETFETCIAVGKYKVTHGEIIFYSLPDHGLFLLSAAVNKRYNGMRKLEDDGHMA